MIKKLSIIIPCYNEEGTISQIINKINEVVSFPYEIIVVDDCSNDKTRSILENDLNSKISKLILNPKKFRKRIFFKTRN